MTYSAKRVSNYEGYRRIDEMQRKIAEGRIRPPRSQVQDHLCPLCTCRKRSQRLVPSRLLGVPVSQLPGECRTQFQGRFIVVCQDCADDLKRARVA